jgi:hypothetical protein
MALARGNARWVRPRNELRIEPRLDAVEDMGLEPVLLCNRRGEKTDWSSAGHEHRPRLPEGALADGSGSVDQQPPSDLEGLFWWALPGSNRGPMD